MNGIDHDKIESLPPAVNLQPVWGESGENNLKATLHRVIVVSSLNGHGEPGVD